MSNRQTKYAKPRLSEVENLPAVLVHRWCSTVAREFEVTMLGKGGLSAFWHEHQHAKLKFKHAILTARQIVASSTGFPHPLGVLLGVTLRFDDLPRHQVHGHRLHRYGVDLRPHPELLTSTLKTPFRPKAYILLQNKKNPSRQITGQIGVAHEISKRMPRVSSVPRNSLIGKNNMEA